MSTATLTHQPMPARAPAAEESHSVPSPASNSASDRATSDARETRLLATIAGVAALIILVFFLVMMWLLSGYGPPTA